MISQELIKKIASQSHTTDFPNIVREYFQHLFLSEFYKLPGAENLLFKGGTALRIIYGSPRFSEDLDFSMFGIEDYKKEKFVESLFVDVLEAIEKIGIKVDISKKSEITTEGYFGDANYQIYDYPITAVTINISSRNGRDIKGEIDTIANEFIPSYNILHLPKNVLVEEKIFSALIMRKKERDFYDLYFLLRNGMLIPDQKKSLANKKNDILKWAKSKDFNQELGTLLPSDHQKIISDFYRALEDELERQLASI